MNGRTLALIILFFGAVLSFGLAVWRAMQGMIPVVETAHAILFALLGLILSSRREEATGGGCRECGRPMEAAEFCLGCGCYPKPSSRRSPHARRGERPLDA